MTAFACIANGHERWSANAQVPRHRHDQGYAAIVLSGFYEECGSLGRFRVGAGDVLLHARFEAHLDSFGAKGARILNLIVPKSGHPLPCGVARLQNVDVITKAAEVDMRSAWLHLHEQLIAVATTPADWPDMLAADLINNPQLPLGNWARRQGLAPETLSRGFQKVFGITPVVFRAEARAWKAFSRIVAGTESLAAIATESGFADQAHMSRATRTLTGNTPGYWRAASNPFKTAASPMH
jgi:AraC-like DNA-binding protein